MGTGTLTESTQPGAPEASRWMSLSRPTWAALAIALAQGPLVLLHGLGLWSNPQYQFFPLVLLGVAMLGWRNLRHLGPLQPGSTVWAGLALAGAGLVLVVAGVGMSPVLGMVAAQAHGLAVAYAWGGGRLVRAVLAAWALVWLMVPPMGLEDRLSDGLQLLASQWSSRVLDLLGVFHVPQGVTMLVDDRQLLIDEACSGIYSLSVVVAATIFFALWERASWPRALVLLGAAVGWVTLINVARIVLATWSWTRWRLDLLEGWPHELLGLAGVLLTLGLLVSTDRIYHVMVAGLRFFVAAPLKAWRRWQAYRARLEIAERHMLKDLPSRPSRSSRPRTEEPAPPPSAEPLPTRWPDPSQVVLSRRLVPVAYGLLAVGMLAWLWVPLRISLTPGSTPPFLDPLDRLTAEDLDAESGPFQRLDFQTADRSVGSIFGQFSRGWRYQFGPHRAIVSVDYSFQGWHNLRICYRKTGWTLTDPEAPAQPPGEFVETAWSQPPRRQGWLVFCLIDDQGRRIVEAPTSVQLTLLERLMFWRDTTRQILRDRFLPPPTSYQLQLFVESERPLTDEEREQARDFFRAFRDRIEQRVNDASRAGAGAAS
jgi:exosortase